MTTSADDYQLNLANKSLKKLEWLRDRWHQLFGVTILNDTKLKQEYERICQAIKDHPDYKPGK